jgi:hypothetical protein
VVTPGGGVAPWAQPQKKRTGLKVGLGCLVAIVLVVLLLGGGGFFLYKKLSSKSSSTASGTPGASATASATPGGNPAGTQTLNDINREAIYAGGDFTIISAKEAASLPELQQSDPTLNVLEVQIKETNQGTRGLNPTFTAIGADGKASSLYSSSPASVGAFWNPGTTASGALFFKVPSGSKIGDFVIQIGNSMELPVSVPLTGTYDPNQWQPVTYPINKSVMIDIGRLKLTVTQIEVVTWNPGFQAPKDMRLLRMYLHVESNEALAANVGSGNYVLVFPNGDRAKATVIYGSLIDAGVAGGESKDVGYDTWVVPPEPADYGMAFFNSDGTPAGQIDLGTV